jgi:hypothetical protein
MSEHEDWEPPPRDSAEIDAPSGYTQVSRKRLSARCYSSAGGER